MYRIGLFSKITKVTVKALRFYEEQGLLQPEYVDSINGYRYYSSTQLPHTFKIVSLRQCGFSIPEIRAVLDGSDPARIFEDKKRELERTARETERQLASITHYLDSIEKEHAMPYQIVLKELPKVFVYSLKTVVDSYDEYFDLMPRTGAALEKTNPELTCVTDPPYCFVRYLDGEYRERDISIELCEAVTGPGNGKLPDGIEFKTIDRVPTAAYVLHKGPYSTLPAAYAAVFKWIEDNGYVASDCPRESYIDGIWNCQTDADWLTELQVPVAREAD
ncbi:MAG TPA: MerR family transcriptional regulator [Treponemataceae bacterium]|nr:MerR family transcriptional regulator [Treponemataceae bacterium]